MAAIVCAACGTPSAGHRQGRPWCRPCGIWLVRCELTGEWVSFAERERRQVRYAELIDQTRQAAQTAVELAQAVVPHGWRVRAGQPLPGACYTLDVQPPASPADVYAYLTPPHSGHGWRVAIYHRTRGVDFPLYIDGGARAAEYATVQEAVYAAVTALRIETHDGTGTPT